MCPLLSIQLPDQQRAGLEKLARDLEARRRLQKNELYPRAVQVDCPHPSCVGIGYLGFDQVMCFFCNHQWAANWSGDMPGGYKRCPKCEAPIDKNGGCDHMTCRCGYDFWWTTLAPYR